nr:preprotein translocase subunit SecE [Agrococcus sp. ARC_14]
MVAFLKEVLVELRKVVTPTRKELIRYTLVVLVFVVFMMLLVSGLDLLFGSFVGWMFGDLPLFGLVG